MNSRQIRKRMHSMEMARRQARRQLRKDERGYLKLGWLSLGTMNGEVVTGLDLAHGKDYSVEFKFDPLLKGANYLP